MACPRSNKQLILIEIFKSTTYRVLAKELDVLSSRRKIHIVAIYLGCNSFQTEIVWPFCRLYVDFERIHNPSNKKKDFLNKTGLQAGNRRTKFEQSCATIASDQLKQCDAQLNIVLRKRYHRPRLCSLSTL